MKLLLKFALALGLVGAFSFASQQAQAGTICYVYLTAPCANPVPAGMWFPDWDGVANLNAARCLERAQEFKNWCQMPNPPAPAPKLPDLEVYTIFQVDGKNVIGDVTANNGKNYIFDGIARLTRFHD